MNPRNKTKIALVKSSKEPLIAWNSWSDGLYGAMQVLAEKYNVRVFGYAEHPATIKKDNMYIQVTHNISSLKYWLDNFAPEYIFGWGTATHPWNEIQASKAKKILLYAGGAYDDANAQKIFNQIVVENKSDTTHFQNSFHAFGTNTKVFRKIEGLQKMFPSLYPATFTLYKRHDLWAKAMPPGSLAVGQMQDHEPQCYEVCADNGHLIMPALPMDAMPMLYAQTQGVCLTPEHDGGCQRAALEAMACNVPVLVTDDSKAAEFEGVWACPPDINEIGHAYLQMLFEFNAAGVDLKEEFITGKYDESTYASQLELAL